MTLRPAFSPLAVLVLAGTIGASAPTGPEEYSSPTGQQLAASVEVFDPRGSVWVWNPAGSVAPVQSTATVRGQTVVTLKSDILFAFGSARLTPAGIARIATLVAGAPRGARVSVLGYTDAIGSDAANRDLSQRRAEAVAGSIAARRADLVLSVAGRGEADPVAPKSVAGKDNPDGRAANRRVEIRYRS